MRRNPFVNFWLLLAFAACSVGTLPGCRSGAPLARRDRSKKAQVAAAEKEQTDEIRRASKGADEDRPPAQDERSVIARTDPPAKPRGFIRDWLHFGEHESVPLPTSPAARSEDAESPKDSVDDFQ